MMANEITVNLNMRLENGALKDSFKPGQLSFDQSVAGVYSDTVEIGTSEETVNTGEISTLGLLILQNLDDTNYVTYGPDSTGMVAFGRIKPGEIAAIRLEPGITIKAQANTAAVRLMVKILED